VGMPFRASMSRRDIFIAILRRFLIWTSPGFSPDRHVPAAGLDTLEILAGQFLIFTRAMPQPL
jgi:hypothetical protein